jgi:hypothetical protein
MTGININQLPQAMREQYIEYYFRQKHIPHNASNMSKEPAIDSAEDRELMF